MGTTDTGENIRNYTWLSLRSTVGIGTPLEKGLTGGVRTWLHNDTSNSHTNMVANLNHGVTMSRLESWHTNTEDDLAVLVDFDRLTELVGTWLEHDMVNFIQLLVDMGSTVVFRGNVHSVERDFILICSVPAVTLLVCFIFGDNERVPIV